MEHENPLYNLDEEKAIEYIAAYLKTTGLLDEVKKEMETVTFE